MSRVCQVTKKRPMAGNNVSHSHRKTRRRFLPNLQTRSLWCEEEQRFIKLRLSAKGLKIITKKGLKAVVDMLRAQGEKI